MNLATHEALIRREEVEARTGLSRAAIYAAMARGDFPRSIPLVPGGRSVAWVASEVDRYVRDRIAAARGALPVGELQPSSPTTTGDSK